MSEFRSNKKTRESFKQLFHYGVIGVTSNSLGYLVYLVATYLGGTPKITMSILYGVGMVISFVGNRKLTFRHKGSASAAGSRFIIAHIFGYIMNFAILAIFVDKLGFPHQWIQAIAIFVVAFFLFFAFKFFVFKDIVSLKGITK